MRVSGIVAVTGRMVRAEEVLLTLDDHDLGPDEFLVRFLTYLGTVRVKKPGGKRKEKETQTHFPRLDSNNLQSCCSAVQFEQG
jgi:hypothetical protein